MFTRPAVRAFLANAALAVFSLLLSCILVEVAYRAYLYKVVSDQLVQLVKENLQPNEFTEFDPEIGYHYRPNKSYTNFGPFQDEFRINEYGFMANDLDPSPYPMQKPKGEYRIAVLGDSFTIGLQNYIRWPDLVQDHLNRSAQWRAHVEGKYTRVLNFGMDGTGIVQWVKVYQARASKFEPDLVIVNFITDDVQRRFVYRGRVQLVDDPDIRRFLRQNVLSKLPWYELHSAVVAEIAARLTGKDDRHLTATAAYRRYTTMDRGTAIAESIAALERIRCLNHNLIILHHPSMEEILVREDTQQRYPWDTGDPPRLVGLEAAFLAAAKEHHVKIVQMADRNPLPLDDLRTTALYNQPIDTHNSDYGVALYAQWVFQYLMEWGASHQDEPSVSRSCAGLG